VASIHPLIQDEWPGCVLADLYAPQRRLLLEALKRFQSLFREKKDRQGALDFGDLEERTIALLKVNTVLRETVCGRFEQVLIDELQDTNRLQWELFSLLRRHGRFFAVGDINQSIYGFRHAEPELFARYREELEKAGLAVDALRGNYRSRAGILQAVDALLKGEAGIEERELEAKAEYPAGSEPCVEILCGQGKSAVEAEASLIAARIRELAGRLLVGQDSPRPAQLLDMAILVRSFAAMDPVTRALDAAGIPYRVNAGRTFLEARETLDLQLLLAVIANPRDSLALAGVMRSPLVGLRDESIFRHVEGLPIADAAEQRRYQQFFNLLNWARAHRDSVAPDAMLAAFLDESGYEARLPERARANVEKFLALLAGLHRRQPRDPAQLLDYLNTLRGAASEAEAPPAEAGNMISVLTFHAAKGLEWPVVFVAALHRRADGSRPSIDFLPDFGLGFRWRGSKPGSSHGDPVWRRIRERWRRRNREEENRLLYVAMTRAKERLILSYSETKQRAEIARRLAEVTRLPDALRVSAAVPVTATAADGREDGVQEEVLARWQASPSPESVMAVTEIAGAFEFAGWRPRQALETGVSAHEWIAKALAGQCPDEDNPAARLGRRFLESDLGRRALAAPRREVEFDFLYAPGPTLVRGQIDLWFEDSRGLVLVDYKTNRQLDSPNLDRYQEQLRQYAAALKAYLARPVTEAWLFDLRQGIAVAVPLPAETQ
jgi:ATP-dependent exoDNAse (exonuclease V) beta subunit